MSTAEHPSKASSAEQANEGEMLANKQMEEQMAQYFMRRFHSHSTYCAAAEVLGLVDS